MALQTDPTVQPRPLNAFMAYRSFYNRMLPNMHQKERSGVLTKLWNADPYKNEWILIAKVFSFLRAEVGKDAVSLPSFLEHACSVLRIPALDAYLEQQGFSLIENDNGKLILIKNEGQDLEMPQAMAATMGTLTHNKEQSSQGTVSFDHGNNATNRPTTAFHNFKERNKENISAAAGVFASGIQEDAVFGDEEAAAGLYAGHELLQAVFDRGLVLNEPAQSSETPETPGATLLNSQDQRKNLIQKLYSKAYEVLIGGEYPVVIGAKGGFSHTIKHNPITAAAQIFARDKPFDFDVLVVDGADEVKSHVLCKVQPPMDKQSKKSKNADSAFVLDPSGDRTATAHKMAGPFSMDPEHQKQWQNRQTRSTKIDFFENDGERSTSLFTQKMAYQSPQNDGKFFIFSCQPPKSNVFSFTESAADLNENASSQEDSPLSAATSPRSTNYSTDVPSHNFPAVFTAQDSSKSPESIDSLDSIDSADTADTIDTIDNNDRGEVFTMATTPMTGDIMQGKTHSIPASQDNSDPFLWGGESASSGMDFNNCNIGYGINHGLHGDVGSDSLGPLLNTGFESGGNFDHNTVFGCNFSCNTTAVLDNNYFAAPGPTFSQDSFCLNPTPTEKVLRKRRHDDNNTCDDDTTKNVPTENPFKRNRLYDDLHYLSHSMGQSTEAITAELSSRRRPAIFDEIYRSQRLEEAMAAACGEHTAAATTMSFSPNSGADSVAAIAEFFGRHQSSDANMALDLTQSRALDALLGTNGMADLGGLTDLRLGLNRMSQAAQGMATPQDAGLQFPAPNAPGALPVHLN